ncbi:hypothetical protein HPB49_003923 [Dermacentor silvarum]|uniref:Uncharacterized protein n=1 Tax=Dermacentor silvarum TaxID=543639 RepID=A0ACB8C7F4_DERSI|nr:hypothetical protein HPB49_003923 [Dermacentor silvarum]
MLMRHVLKEVEEIGFFVVRIVTDNHKINVLAMQLLCNGSLKHCIDHPGKPNRKLFLAFDQCHLIKNVRSQFFSRDIGKGGKISANHMKSLYRMQQGSLVKPVRFLTRKHVFPTNMEKMNVQRAVQAFSPPVTAAMKLLQEQAGHMCDASFAGVGQTVQFMDTVHRWFVLMDVSNCTQHIHQKNADCKQFESAGDERLIWLETSFFDYLADLKSTGGAPCSARHSAGMKKYRRLWIDGRNSDGLRRFLGFNLDSEILPYVHRCRRLPNDERILGSTNQKYVRRPVTFLRPTFSCDDAGCFARPTASRRRVRSSATQLCVLQLRRVVDRVRTPKFTKKIAVEGIPISREELSASDWLTKVNKLRVARTTPGPAVPDFPGDKAGPDQPPQNNLRGRRQLNQRLGSEDAY